MISIHNFIRIEEQNSLQTGIFFFELSKKPREFKPHKLYKEIMSRIFCILYFFHNAYIVSKTYKLESNT